MWCTKTPNNAFQKNEMEHLVYLEEGTRVNLKCEDFFEDFKVACEEIICMEFDEKNKMNYGFLLVPDIFDKSKDGSGTTPVN